MSNQSDSKRCAPCKGTGELNGRQCPACNGSGELSEPKPGSSRKSPPKKTLEL